MTRTLCARLRQTPLALLVAVSAIASACAGGGPTGPSSGSSSGSTTPSPSQPSSPAGVYRFAAVNGQSVPCVFDSYEPGLGIRMAMEAVQGQIILNPDGTYLQEMEMRLHSNVGGGRVDRVEKVGIYTLQGQTLTMTPYQSVPFQPHYTPGQIEIQAEAPGLDGNPEVFIFTFRK
jgi:hypothetical protein